MRLLSWLSRLIPKGTPIERMNDEELLDRWADYSSTKDWWAAEIYAEEIERRKEG